MISRQGSWVDLEYCVSLCTNMVYLGLKHGTSYIDLFYIHCSMYSQMLLLWLSSPLHTCRGLISKVKSYCLRFKSVLTRSGVEIVAIWTFWKILQLQRVFQSMPMSRPWRYDSEQTEYFVQTSDTVKLKKSELERWLHTKDGSEEAVFFKEKLVMSQ